MLTEASTQFILFVFKHKAAFEADSESCLLSKHTGNRLCSEIPPRTPAGRLLRGRFSTRLMIPFLHLKQQTQDTVDEQVAIDNHIRHNCTNVHSAPCSFFTFFSGVVSKFCTSTFTWLNISGGTADHMLSSAAIDSASGSSYCRLSSAINHWPWIF